MDDIRGTNKFGYTHEVSFVTIDKEGRQMFARVSVKADDDTAAKDLVRDMLVSGAEMLFLQGTVARDEIEATKIEWPGC
jgi:hypothetical protein